MRVYTVPMDWGACGYFRVREPARVAAAAGVDVRIMEDNPNLDDKYRGVPINKVWDPVGQCDVIKDVLVDADVFVMQRPLYQPMWAIATQVKNQGMALVVELDDNLHAIHKGNTVAKIIDPANQPLHNTTWAQRTIDMADLLIVSTPALAAYYGRHKSVVVRNWLPEHILPLAPDKSPAPPTVGWTGHVGVHPEDLQVTDGGLRNLTEPFTVVGFEQDVARCLGLPEDKVRLGAPWQENIPAYWAKVAETIRVGVAPLQLSEFNAAKSALKIMEYAALGIPWVASPTPEYLWFSRQSHSGLIAAKRGQWERYTRRLLTQDDLYRDLRDAGLAWARQNTLEEHIGEHIAAWERAYDLVRGQRRHPDSRPAPVRDAPRGAAQRRRPNPHTGNGHRRGGQAASRRARN